MHIAERVTKKQRRRVESGEEIYVLVITCLRGMLLVYGHETRGRVAPEGGVSINRNIPIRHVLIDL